MLARAGTTLQDPEKRAILSFLGCGAVIIAGGLWTVGTYLAIASCLARSAAGDAERQRDLSIAHENVGVLQEALGNRAGALKSYSDSLAMRESLAKSDPANAEWQRDLAVVFSELAVAHMHSRAKEKAAGYVRQGWEIMKRLAKLSPENAQWSQDLAWFGRKRAEVTEDQPPDIKTGQARPARCPKKLFPRCGDGSDN